MNRFRGGLRARWMATAGVIALSAAAPVASAAELANYPFTSGSATSTDTDTGSTAADFVLTATNSSISPTSNNLFLRSSDTAATMEAQAITNNTYVGFTITPGSGNLLSLTSLAFDHGASNSQTDGIPINASVAVKSSVGGFGAGDPTLATFSKSVANGNGGAGITDARLIDLTAFGSAFQNLPGPVEFRFYLFDDVNHTDKINRLDSVVLNGTAVPEPAALGMIALGAIGLLRRPRRPIR